ncbi:hypothetical protein ACFE04_001057 [Oxalis oulophora]
MARTRKSILVGLGLFLILGFAIYFRLWTVDYSISSDEADLLRKQFDLANREAMDESAEWRLKFDEQKLRASKCEKQLIQFTESSLKENRDVDPNQNSQKLQEDNVALRKQVESLRQELEAEKLKCHLQ